MSIKTKNINYFERYITNLLKKKERETEQKTITLSVDIGIRNFFIIFEEVDICFLLDFDNFEIFKTKIVNFLNNIIILNKKETNQVTKVNNTEKTGLIKTKKDDIKEEENDIKEEDDGIKEEDDGIKDTTEETKVVLKIERQIKFNNLKIQHFFEGVCSCFFNKKNNFVLNIININPSFKKNICLKNLDWCYEKIKSKSKIIKLIQDNKKVDTLLNKPKFDYFFIDFKNNFFKHCDNYFKIYKKFDDYIDTKIISLYKL